MAEGPNMIEYRLTDGNDVLVKRKVSSRLSLDDVV